MTIITGFVPTDLGRAVLNAAIREAALRGDDLVIVNSATGAAYADPGLASRPELEMAGDLAREHGVPVVIRQVADALAVAETLLDEADRTGAELVMIGLRSRTRAGKFLMGSTAQTVLLRATCPVLAVKDPAARH